MISNSCIFFFFQAEDGIRDLVRSRGLGDVYKRQVSTQSTGRDKQRAMDFLRTQNKLRAQIQAKGQLTGVRHLAQALRSADSRRCFTVSRSQFEAALSECALFLNTQEVDTLVSHYDMTHTGNMAYEEFLSGVRGTLNHRRRNFVMTLFGTIGGGGESVTADAVRSAFNADAHPEVRAGMISGQEVHTQFSQIFDSNGGLSYDEFERNIAEISACYDKDSDFIQLLSDTFGVDESDGTAEPTGVVGGTTAPFSTEARAMLAVERRRQAEEERKARLLDPKARMIGIDVDALNRQVEEKRQMEHERATAESSAARQARLVAERGMALERQVELQRRQKQCDDVAYNHAYQRKQFRREFDLSNPDATKNDLPIRLGNEDPRLGAASCQVFHGEDQAYGNRVELQRAQQRAWCLSQMDEKAQQAYEKDQADAVFAARQGEFLSRAVELDSLQSRQAREKRMVADEFNHAMVVQKKEETRQGLLQDAAEELEELRCNLDSALLSEVHEPSALGPHRKRQDAYKGMSGDEVVSVYMEQERQRRENAANRDAQGEESQAWADYDTACIRAGMANEREQERKKREQAAKYAEAQREDAGLAATRKVHMDEVFRNEFAPEFFSQFGTSAR
eukprot:TRINITY_DN9577_c0_g1_i1.p1 TRINITY_DN9577_c0_g1~~TRINITY_DN9577_c0_g1_i1.p1  ORF type:complete len:622 (-),score=182.44 TRINITY_DN9577_c0_g1_i1:162-2027(-)